MTSPPRKRKFNPDWPSARADTATARSKRSADRVKKLNEKAKAVGFDTWRLFETAVLKGKINLDCLKSGE